ncbi:DNRLRE domain-containing protein [Lentzea kentuckyensis]|uniref:DNRLRE domain-containing protein n=1 Tax=Lentzea kentuckyensis TaxID=360086 RepID=UPI000A399F7E|nr:DNRLRE domain-containing protein [Lentzea kentuckyensis]
MNRALIVVVVAGVTSMALVAPASADAYDTKLVSAAPGGIAGDGSSRDASFSADGKFVAFASDADNLSDSDDNAHTNVFVRDLVNGRMILVSGAEGNAGNPSISADGRRVVFTSEDTDTCTNEVGEIAACVNVFVRDVVDGTTTLVSRASNGDPADGTSAAAAISPDGQQVVFYSVAANLSDSDQDSCGTWPYEVPCTKVFVRDLAAGTTTYLMDGWATSCGPAISPDGGYAAVESGRAIARVNLRDRTQTWVSLRDDGSWISPASCPAISRDGRRVAFAGIERSGDIACVSLPDGCNNGDEVYVRDVQAGTTKWVSQHAPFPSFGHKASNDPSISADGRFVAFDTANPNLTAAGAGAYVIDLTTSALTFVSQGDDPSLSADGSVVAFDAELPGYAVRNVFAHVWVSGSPSGADLSLTLTASNTSPAVGQNVTYTVTVTNAGPNAATGVKVGGNGPWWGSNLVSATPSEGSHDSVTGLWTVGTIPAGAGATLQTVVRTNAGTNTYYATVNTSDQPDPDSTPGNYNPAEDDQASVTITAAANCAAVTTAATGDSWVGQNEPTTTHGTDATLRARSKANANARTLVRFPLPAIPAGCQVSGAKLRLYSSAAATGRTLYLNRLAAPFTESSVTWNNQPAVTGTSASASSRAGWVEWNATDQVEAMYGGSNHGFRVRDASESAGTAAEQRFTSRENTTNRPELIVTFSPSP